MESDSSIKIVFEALVIALSAVQVVFRRHSSRLMQGAKVVTIAGGAGELAVFTFMPLWALSAALYPFGLSWLELPIPLLGSLRWLGLLLMAGSLPLSVGVFRALGENFSPRLQLFEHHQLVARGPYRVVRHPMYAVFMLCALGSTLAAADAIVAATSAFASLALLLRIRGEEQMLSQRFGDAYGQYRRTTGAIVPRKVWA